MVHIYTLQPGPELKFFFFFFSLLFNRFGVLYSLLSALYILLFDPSLSRLGQTVVECSGYFYFLFSIFSY